MRSKMVPWAFVPDIDNCAQYSRDFLGFHISWEGAESKKPSPPIANTTASGLLGACLIPVLANPLKR